MVGAHEVFFLVLIAKANSHRGGKLHGGYLEKSESVIFTILYRLAPFY